MKLKTNSKIYIAGPMTGLPDFNSQAFNEVAKFLRHTGYVVRNPVEINPDPSEPYGLMMRRCFVALMDCDAVVLLDGWTKSKGAMAEMVAASVADIPCFDHLFNQIKPSLYVSLEGTRL